MSRGLIVERWSLALLHSCSAYCFLGTERLFLRRYDKSVRFNTDASKNALTVYYARGYGRASSVFVIRADSTKEEIDRLGVPSSLWTHDMVFLIFGDEALCLFEVHQRHTSDLNSPSILSTSQGKKLPSRYTFS